MTSEHTSERARTSLQTRKRTVATGEKEVSNDERANARPHERANANENFWEPFFSNQCISYFTFHGLLYYINYLEYYLVSLLNCRGQD